VVLEPQGHHHNIEEEEDHVEDEEDASDRVASLEVPWHLDSCQLPCL
jgi:hypothetical protein